MGKQEVKALLNWTPEGKGFLEKISYIQYPEKQFPRAKYSVFDKEDEDQPFFSEAYLYSLLGKDDARTLLALLRQALEVDDLDEAR